MIGGLAELLIWLAVYAAIAVGGVYALQPAPDPAPVMHVVGHPNCGIDPDMEAGMCPDNNPPTQI
jgi:hypothetical protein